MDEDTPVRPIYHPNFLDFNVQVNYSKEHYLSGEELVLDVIFNPSELDVIDSILHCVSIYIYGIAIFSSKILKGEREIKEFESSFAKECITFPFLTNELDRINNKNDKLRLVFSTDVVLIEPSIGSNTFNKSYTFKIRLPPFLPPTFEGKYTRIRYSTCISAQHAVNGDFKRIYAHFPFTIIGSINTKLPTMDRSHLPIRGIINSENDDLYNKIYDWWLLMNEDSGFDYEGIGSANYKKFIYNFLLQGVDAMELRNDPEFHSDELLDYETLMERRQIEASNTDFYLLKIVSGGIELCNVKLYGSDNSVVAESDNNLVVKLNSIIKMDFEFFCDKYMMKLVQITLTAHEAYRLDIDANAKSDDSIISVHSLQKVVIPPYKEIYNKTILKRFIYCSSYDTTSLAVHIPYIEPSFNWDDIAFYYKLNFSFHITEPNSIGNNKVELSPFSKFKAANHSVNTILIP